MAAKKKKSVTRRNPPYPLKYYEDAELERLKEQAATAGVSLSGWVRLLIEEVVLDPQGVPRPAVARQTSIVLSEEDKQLIEAGASQAGIAGSGAWLRYILLAAAQQGEIDVLVDQLKKAASFGRKYLKKKM